MWPMSQLQRIFYKYDMIDAWSVWHLGFGLVVSKLSLWLTRRRVLSFFITLGVAVLWEGVELARGDTKINVDGYWGNNLTDIALALVGALFVLVPVV